MFDFIPSVVSDLIAGLLGSGIVGFAAVVVRKVGWRSARRFAELLGWPLVAAAFFAGALLSAILRGGTVSVVVLGALLVVAAFVMLLRFGPVRPDLRVVRFIQAYPWRIIAAIFFVASVVLFFTDVEGSTSPDLGERIVFVVALADEELMVMRDILDELEPELGAEVFLMNSKSGRYVGALDRMVTCGDEMNWDLMAVDNNKVGMLGAKELVEELSGYADYDEIIPLSMLPSLGDLPYFEDKFYFAPFRPNVKIAFYNEKKFIQRGLDPPETWDDLLHVAELFKDSEGVGRVAIQGKADPKAVSAVTAYEFIKAAGGDPMTLDDDRTRMAFEFLQDLSEYLAPQYTETDWDTANEYLINDAVYLVDNWTFGIKVIVEDARKTEIKAYSGWEGPGREFHVLGGDVLAVPKGAPHPEKAVKLIELLLSQETQEKLVDKLRWPPMRLDAYGEISPEMAPYFKAVRDGLSSAETRPNVPQWALVEDILADAFQGLVVNGDDISTLDTYIERMKQVPSTYIRYRVKEGDTLESLAERYRTTVEMLAKVNDIPTWTSICQDQILLVPPQRFTSQPSAGGSLPGAR